MERITLRRDISVQIPMKMVNIHRLPEPSGETASKGLSSPLRTSFFQSIIHPSSTEFRVGANAGKTLAVQEVSVSVAAEFSACLGGC